MIHAFAVAPPSEPIYMAKWDIKDGFWRLDCAPNHEWSFAYVLPHNGGGPILVVPSALQMGWIESPAYFCAASETARDVAETYADTPLGSIPVHPFIADTQISPSFMILPPTDTTRQADPWTYMIEVYMDDFIGLARARSAEHLNHLATAVMTGIHDVFPPDENSTADPISHKKRKSGDAAWDVKKDLLGITFDGTNKTLWLAEEKRDSIIATLRSWLRLATNNVAIPFADFQSTMSKVRHEFITIPSGNGLLSPFYSILATKPKQVFLHTNTDLR